jgi:hypothetical protein
MVENTVKVDIWFRSLIEAISSLGTSEKHQLLELLKVELFPDDEDSTDDFNSFCLLQNRRTDTAQAFLY